MVTNLLTPAHIAILLVVAFLIFGPKRLPQTGRALGSALREFKDAISGRDLQPAELPNCDATTPTPGATS